MAEIKIDRRVRKTRALLYQCLTELLKEKELKDITVKELSERADINRGTFYLHYKDVFDMMDQIQKEMIAEFNTILDCCTANGDAGDPYPLLLEIYCFLEKNKEIGKVLLGPHGDLNFVNGMKDLVRHHVQRVWSQLNMKSENFDYYCSYCISGILGLIECWIEGNDNRTPEDMALLSNGIVIQTLDLFNQ